ncbi:MAG TPA: MlaD family protein [Verrucomicrobiota bacterium]|nr:MlaD family protein [Verrucomicrobiota bacterium]
MSTNTHREIRSTASVRRGLGWVMVFGWILLTGCGGPTIRITWDSPKPGLEQGVPLKYESVEVGKVTKVDTTAAGVTVTAKLRSASAHHVRVKSAFVFHPAGTNQPAYINIRALDRDSSPVQTGAILRGSASEEAATIEEILTDWKRTLLFCAMGIALLLVVVWLTKLLFKAWVLMFTVAAGVASTVFLSAWLEATLAPLLPPTLRVDLIAYVAAFVVGSVAASTLVGVLLRPRS